MKKCINNMQLDLISLVIINYNNKDYLSRCVESIFKQTYKKLEIIFIDNESRDGSFKYMKERYSDKNIFLIQNNINNGYSGAANQGIKLSNGKYIMIINPDLIMDEKFIENLWRYASANDEIGAVSGKLLKYNFETNEKLNYIDSAGIIMYRNRRCIDRGQNEKDLNQYEKTERVFGVCGAAPFYSRKALDKVALDGEYFDEDFFAYKEDVDLSWRLNLAGFKCMYYPRAIAYHGRALGRSNGGKFKFIKHRAAQSKFLRGISTRNQILMLIKNETKESFERDKYKIVVRELQLFIYYILFEQFNFKYINQAIRMKKKMKKKREIIMSNKRISNDELEKIFMR